MATEAQIDANRANAQSSTGPTTPTGKETCSKNAITHALTVSTIERLPEDARELFYSFREQLWQQLQPVTPLEEQHLAAYAFLSFQYQRALAVETVYMEEACASPDNLEFQRKWLNHIKITQQKARAANGALRDFQLAQQNRMIATQISEEFNKVVPSGTPFVQLHTRSQLRKTVNPYTLAVAAVFPKFEPRPLPEEAEEAETPPGPE